MKPPAFWSRPSGLASTLLAPLGQLYRAAGILRRVVTKPYRAKIPVICVGNVVAGGAGKTPTALALAALLQKQGARPAFVLRGYGGLEAGPLRVDPERHNVRDVGDEALVLACAAPCWIGRNRAAAIRAAEPHATHIIMDDGLQNPTVAPTKSLLVIDAAAGLGNASVIPAGPLREPLSDALKRVQAIILIDSLRHSRERGTPASRVGGMFESLRRSTIPTFHAHLKPSPPENFAEARPCLAFAGIGRPDKFFHSCLEIGLTLAETRGFPDHHLFTSTDLGTLADHAMAHNLQLITTAKDYVRLPDAFRKNVAVLPVELVFEKPQELLNLLSSHTAFG